MRTNNLGRLGRRGVAAPGPRPTFGLYFLSGLMPAGVNFSRASNATRVNAAGLIEWAPHNLLTRSEAFEDAGVWPGDRSTILANQAVAPDGTMTADKLVEDLTFGAHRVRQYVPASTQGAPHTFSVYVKPAGRNFAHVRMENNNSTQLYGVSVDLITGQAVPVTFGAPTVFSTAVQQLENGWLRISVSWVLNSAGVLAAVYANDALANTSYQGDGVSGVFVWGAHMELSATPRAYVPTTAAQVFGPRFDTDPVTLAPLGLLIEDQRTNELVYSEDITQANWVKNGSTAALTALASPAASRNAYKVAEDATNAAHQVNAALAAPASSQPYTFSCFVKAAERGFAHLQANTTGATSPSASVIFSLSSAAFAIDFDTGLSVSNVFSYDYGNGWRRVGFTFTSPASCTQVAPYVGPALNAATRIYNGTAGSGVLVFGLQVEKGLVASSYIPTFGTATTRSQDVCTAGVTPWLNGQRGTMLVQARAPNAVTPGGTPTTLLDIAIDGANRMQLRHETGGMRPLVVNAGATPWDAFVPNPAPGTVYRSGFAYRPGSGDVAAQGVSSSDAAVTYFNLLAGTLYLGRGNWGGEYLNGHLQAITYYATDFTVAQLRAATV